MQFEFETVVLAVAPWALLAGCVAHLYRIARIYRKTRLVTAQLCGFFAFAVGVGCLGVSQFRDLLPRWLRITAEIVAIVSCLVALVLLAMSKDGLKARP
jgi:hypothetical protein